MHKYLTLAFLLLAARVPSPVEREAAEVDNVPFVRMNVRRLPDLNRPRAGGVLCLLEDELTIFGGHTEGFTPLQTAEYYKDGAWREVSSLYTHDHGFVTTLADGTVMLGGGCPENFGIGQSWGAETYSRESHSFKPEGILDRKRSGATAAALRDGETLVCGNWYGPDAIEVKRAGEGFELLTECAEPRSFPYILPDGPSGVVIFGSTDNYGRDTKGLVDMIPGAPRHEPLLDKWGMISCSSPISCEDQRIGEYDYLIPAKNRTDGRMGLLRVNAGRFSEIETQWSIPTHSTDSSLIMWSPYLQVDRSSRTAWIPGCDMLGRFYAAEIGYDPCFEGKKASIRILWAEIGGEPFPIPIRHEVLLLSGGSFALVGGIRNLGDDSNNFETSASAYILSLDDAAATAGTLWWIIAAAVLIAGGLIALALRYGKKRDTDWKAPAKNDLMSRLCALMEEKELFRTKGLTKADVAKELGTNVSYVSACINAQAGKSFPEFVSDYRIKYAQDLMRKHPGMVLSDVAEESGFSSEQSFFRTFKERTGLTPHGWKMKN